MEIWFKLINLSNEWNKFAENYCVKLSLRMFASVLYMRALCCGSFMTTAAWNGFCCQPTFLLIILYRQSIIYRYRWCCCSYGDICIFECIWHIRNNKQTVVYCRLATKPTMHTTSARWCYKMRWEAALHHVNWINYMRKWLWHRISTIHARIDNVPVI